MKKIISIYLKEQLRNKAVFLSTMITPFIIIICAFIMNKKIPTVSPMIIKLQFIPLTLLMAIFMIALSPIIIYIAECHERKTFLLLQRTDLKTKDLFLGLLFASLIILNAITLAILLAYNFIVAIQFKTMLTIILYSNITLISLYPLSYLIASYFKTTKSANSVLAPIFILLILSVNLPPVFAALTHEKVETYYKFMVWNPMLFFQDITLVSLGSTAKTWLPTYCYNVGFILIFTVSYLLSKRSINKINLKN